VACCGGRLQAPKAGRWPRGGARVALHLGSGMRVGCCVIASIHAAALTAPRLSCGATALSVQRGRWTKLRAARARPMASFGTSAPGQLKRMLGGVRSFLEYLLPHKPF